VDTFSGHGQAEAAAKLLVQCNNSKVQMRHNNRLHSSNKKLRSETNRRYISLLDTYNLSVSVTIFLSELCSLVSSLTWPQDHEVLLM